MKVLELECPRPERRQYSVLLAYHPWIHKRTDSWIWAGFGDSGLDAA